MTNYLTILDGSLDELGENLATNLVAMGVSDADKTDGLTTLANKILNAEPSVAGLELNTNLTLTKITENLYTATLTGEYDDTTVTNVDLIGVITGATITLKDGQTTIGTGVTDNNGIATIGVELNEGQHTLKAVFAGTENFEECESTTMSINIEFETFTDLQTLINNAARGSTITLNKSYKYNASTDSSLTNGIKIEKNITINGNGHIIDGNNTMRAFYVDECTVNLNDLILQNNTATKWGGAIYATSAATVNITQSTLQNNQTTNGNGGAIYSDDGYININNSTLQNNNANGHGGAIYADYSEVDITQSTFTNNNATGNGGAIVIGYQSHINMTLSIIKNNTATNFANISCNYSATVYDCEINDISTTCNNVTNVNTQ